MTAEPPFFTDLDGVRRRHRAALHAGKADRLREVAIAVSMVALAGVALWSLEFSFARIWNGPSRRWGTG